MSELLSKGTASANMSTPESALRITEILDRIFSFNEVSDAARCARVCKAWTDISVDHVWHTVRDIVLLLSFLAPLKTTEGGLIFERKITPNDWTRFYPIAKRVKVIDMPSQLGVLQLPSSMAIVDLLLSRLEETVILPNLKVLHVKAAISALSWASMLIHKGLEVFVLKTDIESPVAAMHEYRFLDSLRLYRAPNLKYLALSVEGEVSNNALVTLASTLSSQLSLETLLLTPGTLTTPVLRAVSRLPKLKQLYLNDEGIGTGEYEAVKSLTCDHAEAENCFPSLTGFEVQTRVIYATTLIQTHPTFVQLEYLTIEMVFQNNAEDIRRCLEVISSTCKKLRILVFSRCHDNGDRPEVLEQETDPITKETLATLSSFRFLEEFALVHTQSVTMTNDDLVDLLGGCHSLTFLFLNPCPVKAATPESPIPSLGVLHRIAQCCPKLRKLAICMDGADGVDPSLPYSLDDDSLPFSELKLLDMGKSTIGDAERVTIYLSQVLPEGCKLKFLGNIKWEEVTKWLPSLTRMNSEQRQRNHALTEEVEIMKAKLASLGE